MSKAKNPAYKATQAHKRATVREAYATSQREREASERLSAAERAAQRERDDLARAELAQLQAKAQRATQSRADAFARMTGNVR